MNTVKANLELQNPFAQDFPDNVESSLDSLALVARFNPHGLFAGHYLAVGRIDGCVSVLDFHTHAVVKFMEGHVKAVTAVQWSRKSRYLMTASRDWNVIIWDLETGERRDTIRFDAPVTSAHLHPRNSKVVVVTLQSQAEAVFVDLRSGGGRWELDYTGLQPGQERRKAEDSLAEGSRRRREAATVVRFNPKGDLIYVGTSHGALHVFDVRTKQLVHTERISNNNAIKNMEFDRTGCSLVLNTNDRVLRVYTLVLPSSKSTSRAASPSSSASAAPLDLAADLKSAPAGTVPEFILGHKFQDIIQRSPWKSCLFSRNAEYVIGGAGHKEGHQIFIWDRGTGALTKILEGRTDPLEDVDWHPTRPIVASVSNLGLLHIWVTTMSENWSAYAPGFEELDENVEYQEQEDEFDYEDESALQQRKRNDQAMYVDILSVDRPPSPFGPDAFADFEADDDTIDEFFIPIDYDLDETLIGDDGDDERLPGATPIVGVSGLVGTTENGTNNGGTGRRR